MRGMAEKSGENSASRVLMAYSFFNRALMNINMNYSGVYAAEVIGLNPNEFGIIGAISTIITQATQPLWGYLSDLKGVRKYFTALGEVLSGLMIALTFTLKTYPQYLITSIILWSFWSGAYTCWQALIGDITIKSGRGKTIGTIELIGGLGSIISGIMVGPLMDLYGYTSTIIISVIFTIFTAIPILMIHERRDSEKLERDVKKPLKRNVTKEYRKFLIISIIWWGVMSISWPLFSITQVRIYNLTKTEIAILSVLGSIGQMAMMPIWGNLADKIGRRNLLVIACASTSIWSLAYAISQNYVQLLILNTIGSIFGSAINIIPGIYLLDTIPDRENRATLIAIYNTSTGVSQALGQYMGGEIASWVGLREAMMLSFLSRLIFSIPILLLPETLSKKLKED